MHTGRHRYKTHAGIPQGSTVNVGDQLDICYLWKEGYTHSIEEVTLEDEDPGELDCLSSWGDQGPATNDASMDTIENRPVLSGQDGAIIFFNHSDNADFADSLTCTKFNVPEEAPFLTFIVCNLDSTASSCYLSDSGAEVLEYKTATQHQLKTGITNTINHVTHFSIAAGSKHLFMVHRTGTEDIKLYANGFEYDGSITNNGDFDIENIGVKAGTSNWFDGFMYDLGVIHGDLATNANRILITNYLLTKHGIEQYNPHI